MFQDTSGSISTIFVASHRMQKQGTSSQGVVGSY